MEINERTLVRLTEKASTITPEDKNELYHKIILLIDDGQHNNTKASAQEILRLLQTEVENRVSSLAGDLINPKSAIPNKPAFRRVDAEEPAEPEPSVSSLIILGNG